MNKEADSYIFIKYWILVVSKTEAGRLRNLTTDKAMNASYYGEKVGLPQDSGTAHISVIDPAELMVSVTT